MRHSQTAPPIHKPPNAPSNTPRSVPKLRTINRSRLLICGFFFRIWVGDVPSVEILDRFMVLKEGGVMEQGSHKELLEQWRSSD
jgi:hypothetical protein